MEIGRKGATKGCPSFFSLKGASQLLLICFFQIILKSVYALTSQDFLVKKYVGLGNDSNLLSFAGQLLIRDQVSLFFWLFPRESQQVSNNLVLWFNGGPGCTSMDGLVLENGPLRFDENPVLHRNPYSLHRVSNIIYVDQPAGTGLSFLGRTAMYPENEKQVAEDMEIFILRFLDIFPEYRNSKLFLAGESYAGTYIPYIASRFLDQKLNLSLSGLIIGNGWIDPRNQYPSFLALVEKYKIIDADYMDSVRDLNDLCERDMQKLETMAVKLDSCDRILEKIQQVSKVHGSMCINIYDWRLRDLMCGSGWPPGLDEMNSYFSSKEVQDSLNVKNFSKDGFVECDPYVYSALTEEGIEPSVSLFPSLLENLQILLFVGDRDIICNHLGIEAMISNLTWMGQKGFQSTPYSSWEIAGKQVGLWRTAGNLTYARVFNGSHMLGVESAPQMLSLVELFLGEESALESKLHLIDGPVIVPGEGIIGHSNASVVKPSPAPSGPSTSVLPVTTSSSTSIPTVSYIPSPSSYPMISPSSSVDPFAEPGSVAEGKIGEAAAILLTILLFLGIVGLTIAFFLRYRRHSDGRTLLPDNDEDEIELGNVEVFALGAESDSDESRTQ